VIQLLPERSSGRFLCRAGEGTDALITIAGAVDAAMLAIPDTSTVEGHDLVRVVVSAEAQATSTLIVTLTNRTMAEHAAGVFRSAGFTVISTDGQRSRSTFDFDDSIELQMVAGDYFVIPFTMAECGVGEKAARLIREGRIDLEASGIPRVRLVEGQTTSITLDMLQGYQILHRLPIE